MKLLNRLVILFLGLLLSTGLTQAQQIYKSVDDAGVVTYSTIPPDGAQPLESFDTLTEPSPEAIAAAEQRLQKIRESTREIQRRRAERRELGSTDSAAPADPASENAGTPPNNETNPLPKLAPLPSVGF